ncbi:MAG: SURF1 family protein [Devosia sp.]
MTGSEELDAAPPPRPRLWRDTAFAVLMLGLTALFAALGLWQWQRLAEKEALIATVESRMVRNPSALPTADQWSALDTEFYNYRPLTVTGRFLPDETVLVFTSLASAQGKYSGPGYWVMTPFAFEGGGTLFVNRGFVPQQFGPAFVEGGAVPQGMLTLTGVARASEEAGGFTPGADPDKRIEWVRNTARLARLVDPVLAPVAPLYLDLPAGDPGALPQGGETVVEFPNNHLGYALTWFGFALLTPILLAFWLFRRRRSRAEP